MIPKRSIPSLASESSASPGFQVPGSRRKGNSRAVASVAGEYRTFPKELAFASVLDLAAVIQSAMNDMNNVRKR